MCMYMCTLLTKDESNMLVRKGVFLSSAPGYPAASEHASPASPPGVSVYRGDGGRR